VSLYAKKCKHFPAKYDTVTKTVGSKKYFPLSWQGPAFALKSQQVIKIK
jgi:hypothetical protein